MNKNKILMLLFLVLIFITIILLIVFYPDEKKISTIYTEKALINFFENKQSLTSHYTQAKYSQIMYKNLCKCSFFNENKILETCKTYGINEQKECFQLLTRKFIHSNKVKSKLKKDIIVAYLLTIIKTIFPNEILTKDDYYDKTTQILYLKKPTEPRLTENNSLISLYQILNINKEETTIEELQDIFYNYFLTQIQDEEDLVEINFC